MDPGESDVLGDGGVCERHDPRVHGSGRRRGARRRWPRLVRRRPAVGTTGPYRVGTRSVTFVDDSRPTPAYGASPAVGTRHRGHRPLVFRRRRSWRRAGRRWTSGGGPFPLIVFNHGQQGEPGQYALSFEVWARAGYVVAAPRHPLTVRGGPGAQFAHDVEGELGDVPFVVTSIDHELSDLADVDHLAVAGHSSGAIVALGSAFSPCCGDDRVDAVLTEALPVPPAGDVAGEMTGTPVMFIHGTRTSSAGPVPRGFEAAEPPKYFLTVLGGDHSDAYRSGPSARSSPRRPSPFSICTSRAETGSATD